MGAGGIALRSPQPPAIRVTTSFQVATIWGSAHPDTVSALLTYLVSGECAEAKLRHGMEGPEERHLRTAE